MVNHIVCWNFKEELTEEERVQAGQKVRQNLTGLRGQIEGLLDIEVYINKLDSSNRDIALICTFDSVDALNRYQTHPKHLEAAGYVRSVTCDRVCFDY